MAEEKVPWYKVLPSVPRCMWRRFERSSSQSQELVEEEDARVLRRRITNRQGKRQHPHDDEQQQGRAEKRARHPTTTDEEELATGASASSESTLPFLLEYTAEDVSRLNREMAETDKLLDEAMAKLVEGNPPLPPSSLLPELEAEDDDDQDEDYYGMPSEEARIKWSREFVKTKFHPISERILSDPLLFDEVEAEELREGNRFISKVYANRQAIAAAALAEYDAKGYLDDGDQLAHCRRGQ